MPADFLQRLEGQVAQQKGRDQGGGQHESHQRERRAEPGSIDGAEKRGAHADVHACERLAIALQRDHHIVDSGRAEDSLHKLERIGVKQLLVIGTHGQRLVFVLRVRT